MRNHDSGTIEKIATRPLIRSHLCHQIRFNNSTRRSYAPTGTAETKEKYYKSTKHKKKNIRRTRINIQRKYSQNKFLPVRRNRIALQYVTPKQDTRIYQEETQTKFKYPAETTANAAKIPRQMPLFIKTISDNKLPEK
jgi:hypothetical protein